MSKAAAGDNKNALVPKLRFPEFRDATAWRPESLGELCKRITNGKANAQDHEDGGLYPLFDRSEVVKRSNAFDFDAEAVIVPGEGMRLTPRYFKGKFNLHQRAYALMEHQGDARFIFYALDRFNGELVRNAVQSTVPSLRLPIIEGFVIPASDKSEQQKIADCLSSLDALIAAHTDKLAALKTHKQGLLQQLFPRAGETVPRLRFPEFRNAGEWVYKSLGKIADAFLDGDWIESKDQSDNGIRLLQTGNVGLGEFIDKSNHARFISSATFARLKCNEVLPGDCLISRLPDPVGRACIVPDNGQRMITAVDCTIVRLDDEQCLPYLFFSLAQTKQYFAEVDSWSSGSTRKRISRVNLSRVRVPLPKESAEQQKIADCLSTLDTLITAQTDKIAALKQHKQGLLQQLFPAMDEATA